MGCTFDKVYQLSRPSRAPLPPPSCQVPLESNCQRRKRGQQPEDIAVGRPERHSDHLACVRTSRRGKKKNLNRLLAAASQRKNPEISGWPL